MMVLAIVILLFSVILHEIAHGWVALKFGDPTAKHLGRLTLNPIPHIDPVGTIILPAFLIISGSPFVFGWAKPVPVNFYRLYPQRLGNICVALAGIAANLTIVAVAVLIFRLAGSYLNEVVTELLFFAVLINLILAFFNLIPIPPLDGSRILTMWLPYEVKTKLESISPFFFIILFMILVYSPLWPFMIKFIIKLSNFLLR